MPVNKFLTLMYILRRETDRFCRGSAMIATDDLESLGLALASRYHCLKKDNPLFDALIIKFVINYGKKGEEE